MTTLLYKIKVSYRVVKGNYSDFVVNLTRNVPIVFLNQEFSWSPGGNYEGMQ